LAGGELERKFGVRAAELHLDALGRRGDVDALGSDGEVLGAERKIYAEVPPRVEYSLTAAGRTLKPIIDGLHEWGLAHLAGGKKS
jgi:hypothetical protein